MIRLVLAAWAAVAALIAGLVLAVAGIAASGAGTLTTAAVTAQQVAQQYAARSSCGAQGVGPLLAANAARAAGWPDEHLVTAVAVAGAESGFDPLAGNRLADGRTHRGLMQISSLHLRDPAINPGGAQPSGRVVLRGGQTAAGWRVDNHPVSATLDGGLLRHTGGGTWRSALTESVQPPFTVTARMRVTRLGGDNALGAGNATDPGLKLILFTAGDWRSRGNYQLPVQTLRGETFVSRRPRNATPSDYTFADRGTRRAAPGEWQDVAVRVEPAPGGLLVEYRIGGELVASRVDRSPLPGPFHVGIRSDGADWEVADLRVNGAGRLGGDPRLDPVENMRMALRLFQRAGSWQPWEAYTNGSWRRFVAQAEGAVAGTQVSVCSMAAGPLNDDRDQPRTARIRAAVQQQFGPIEIGGFRTESRGAGHKEGRALDVMTYTDEQLGWQVTLWVQENFGADLEYVIYQQMIWHPSSSGWRPMADRGSPTANHEDHPHFEVLPG